MSDQPKSGKLLRRGSAPISGNGKRRLHAPILALGSITQEERRTYLKYALFCLTIAALLIIGNQLGKKAPTTIGQSASTLNVRFDLSFEQAQGKLAGEGSQSESGGRLVTFRLSNRGNNSAYYAVHPGTNVVIGHLVYRRAVSSEWMALPGPSKSAVTSQAIDRNVAWIEMPPGGWIDGQFEDPSWPGGDHAYVVELKSERDAKVVSMVSPPYRFTAN